MKVGVFGGTFDPIHIGHLIVAQEASVLLDLDEVLFIPAGQPWLKSGTELTEAHHRLAMVELAIAPHEKFRASDMEIRRAGPTYTVDTLIELRDQLGPDAGIYMILGLDSLRDLGRWYQPERMFDLATLVGISRPGHQDFDPRTLDTVIEGASEKIVLLEGPRISISGTEIRQRVSDDLPIKFWVPEAVEKYIHEHRLYR